MFSLESTIMGSFFEYTTPPSNYIGTTLFLSYIVAALLLTSTISYSLYSQYTIITFSKDPSSRVRNSRQDVKGRLDAARAQQIIIFAILALISFTSISYHMLGFLITSFLDWNNGSTTRNVLSVLSSDAVRRWMLETSLFNDFALELVGDAESVLWTQLAIVATWLWNLWIAGKGTFRTSIMKSKGSRIQTDCHAGRRYNFSTKTMLPFIVLGQNLPISFSVALFIIQLHLAAPSVTENIEKHSKAHPSTTRNPTVSSMLPTIILNAALLAQPSLRHHAGFSLLVLTERALLVLPHTGCLTLSDAEIKKSAAISGAFVAANWAMLRHGVGFDRVLAALTSGGQALKTMGWDAVLSAVVYGALSWDQSI